MHRPAGMLEWPKPLSENNTENNQDKTDRQPMYEGTEADRQEIKKPQRQIGDYDTIDVGDDSDGAQHKGRHNPPGPWVIAIRELHGDGIPSAS